MISAIILIAIVIGLYFLFKALGLTDISKEEIRDIVSQAGIWAPLAYILVSFLQVTFIPIPGMVTILAGTLIFDPLEAFFYSLIGMFLGGSVGFYLGRILGKKFVYWIAGDKQKVDEYLDKIKGRETVLLFFMFLSFLCLAFQKSIDKSIDFAIHNGIDIACAMGDPVLAIAAGTVEEIYEDALEGTIIVLQHEEGIVSKYCGLAPEACVAVGDAVQAGDAIGTAGNTMKTESLMECHVHLVVKQDGKYIDPLSLKFE